MNELLLLVKMLFVFSAILLALKWFGKAGIFAWLAIATIMANIFVTKSVEVFGISAAMGNVLFASTFLATDILNEKYGAKEAKKGVYIGLFAVLFYLGISQIGLLFVPSGIDTAHGSMAVLFGLAPRVCIASVAMYFLANMLDVVLYEKLRKRHNGKKMWLRNNVCTLVCNGLENFGFTLLAFAGVYSMGDILMIAISGSIIECAIALCDTPFLYMAKRMPDAD